ncbi:MAG: NUDIX hydrolase [Deltaproteobacteria bacterium]|nr:NUDIX hydrolase [Deltaproteobacteria bacterium]
MIDKDDGDPHETAKGELLEEAGYRVEDLFLLIKTYPQPAVLNNTGLTYLARDVTRAANPSLDAAEDIEVCLVELERIPEMIRKGEICQNQTVMALSLCFFSCLKIRLLRFAA